jgi:predicted ATPase/DNA-binding SARP family transcriptional activator
MRHRQSIVKEDERSGMMDTILSIGALGPLRIRLDGQPVEPIAQKAGALLVYLAYSGHSHPREHLAELLWYDRSPERAFGSLRMALAALRQHIPAHLETSRLAVGLVPGSYRLDAQQLVSALNDFRQSQGRMTASMVRSMVETLGLYRGDFLCDFLGGSPEFENWLYSTREYLRECFCEGTLLLADYHAQAGDYAAALDVLYPAYQIDSLNEPINRQMMLMLRHSGRGGEALEYYRAYCDRLAAELDTAPSAEMSALYHLLWNGSAPNGESDSTAAYMRMYPTPVVGRENLLLDIAERLSGPNGNLLTLVGPGGIGKTRLAQAAGNMARHNHVFPDGVFFVPLAACPSAAQIPVEVAAALGYRPIADGRSLRRQVMDFVRPKKALFVLDNYEHLLDGRDFAEEIAANPDIRVVVTSREPLNLAGEQLLSVAGLAHPAVGSPPPNYDAARLFVRAVQRLYPDYVPDTGDYAPVAQLCRLVDGSPLALLLAASWMDVLTPQEIAAHIQGSIEILDNRVPGLPERHHSIRAVFAATWERLTSQQQTIFMKLSVCRGGFSRSAAQAVAGAGIRDLQELVSRAFIARDAGGRFTIHELLRQYAEDQLREAGLDTAARDAHSAFYLNLLIEREADIKGKRQPEALKEIDLDFENVRAAWAWASERGSFNELDQALEPFYWYCDFQLRQAERLTLLRTALEQAERANEECLRGRLLARCWENPAEGRVRLRRALAIALRAESAEDIAQCLYQRGRVALSDAKDSAPRLLERAYHAYCDLGDGFYRGVVSSDWAVSLIYAGHADQSETICAREVSALRQSGNQVYLARLLFNYASSLATRGANEAADRFHQEARAIFLERGQHLLAADIAVWGMGVTALRAGNYELVRQRAQEAMALAQEYHAHVNQARALSMFSAVALVSGDAPSAVEFAREATCMLGSHANATYADAYLAAAAAATGDFHQAREICQRWLGLAVGCGEKVLTSLLLVPTAAVLAHSKQYERAAECASLAWHYPASMGRWAEDVLSLYGMPALLADNLSPDGCHSAWERGKTLDLRVLVEIV